MKSTSKIEVDYSNNPDLAEIFAGKKIGDKCVFEVSVQITEIDEKRVVASVEKVTSDYGDKDEKEATPSQEEPLAMSLGPSKTYPEDAEES